LQAELAQREEDLLKFETLHKLIRGQLEARACEAERRAARLAARSRQLQQRQAQEMEGWASDVGQLRKRIAAVDRRLKQMNLEQRLPDDERRDAILARHARSVPSGMAPVLGSGACKLSTAMAVLWRGGSQSASTIDRA
jgi:hypothetical protein